MPGRSLKKKTNKTFLKRNKTAGKRNKTSGKRKTKNNKLVKKNNRKGKVGGKRVKKTLKKRNKMFGGASCIGPYEACNFYHHLKYTHNYNQDMLAGDPKTVNPDPTVQELGNH